jgi:hypothetical protein
MKIDLSTFRHTIEAETHRYLSEYVPSVDTLGRQWSREKMAAKLAEMRQCLIEPYWIEVDLPDPPFGHEQQSYRCVAVAEDPGAYLMVYVPDQEEFLLLWPDEGKWRSLGVDGDAVGTFLAR